MTDPDLHDDPAEEARTFWRAQLAAAEARLSEDPNDRDAHRVRIQAGVASGSIAGPIAAMTHHLDTFPEDAEAWNLLSAYFLMSNQPEAALAASDRALSLSPEQQIYRYNRACAAALLGKSDDALRDLARAIDCDIDLREFARDDESLVVLRSRSEFQKLVGDAEPPR